MSPDPHNKPEEDQNHKSARLLRLVSGMKKLASNDAFFDFSIDLLSKYSFRVLVAVFALYGTYSALQHISFGETDSTEENSVVVEEKDEPDEERFIGNYAHIPIEQEGMDEVCNDNDFQKAKLGSVYPISEYDIRSLGAEYKEDRVEVFPVFRWACGYLITAKTDRGQNSSTEESDDAFDLTGSSLSRKKEEWVGLSLDEFYCEGKLDTPAHLDFEDPNSWYCINANANF